MEDYVYRVGWYPKNNPKEKHYSCVTSRDRESIENEVTKANLKTPDVIHFLNGDPDCYVYFVDEFVRDYNAR
jgi:hypothetical protein